MKKFYKINAIITTLALILIGVCAHFNAATIFKRDGFLYAYTGASKADLYGRESDDADLVIPREFSEYYITNIVDSAFSGDANIQTLSFAKATMLERIGFYAFKNCIHLSGPVTFGGRINTIGTSAFEDCTSLETVVFNAYVKDIPDQCFYNCSALNTVVMNDRIQTIGKFAFGNCTSLKEITIPDSVTSINATAFDGCEDLVIYCNSGSYAHEFAEENQITHVLLDVNIGYYLGDVDNNESIEIIDVTCIQRILANVGCPDGCDILHGNVDGEDGTTIIDATILMRYLSSLSLPADYPIGEFIDQYERHEF